MNEKDESYMFELLERNTKAVEKIAGSMDIVEAAIRKTARELGQEEHNGKIRGDELSSFTSIESLIEIVKAEMGLK